MTPSFSPSEWLAVAGSSIARSPDKTLDAFDLETVPGGQQDGG